MKRHGIVLFEALVVVFLVGSMLLLASSSFARSRELSRRAVCAANIRGIGQACKIYANDFREWWPVAPHNQKKFVRVSAIGTHRDDGDAPHADPSVGQSLYILIKAGGTTFKQFVCPEAFPNDNPDPTRNPMPYFDFMSATTVSYGYQHPYGSSKAKPTERLAPQVAMLADKCHYYVGAALKAGKDTNFNAWAREAWRPYNSENHQREGQNVLFLDGHCSFERTAACGMKREGYPRNKPYPHKDLIYENADGVFGGAAKGWPLDPIDSVLVHGPTIRPSKPRTAPGSRPATPVDRPSW